MNTLTMVYKLYNYNKKTQAYGLGI